jgi:hypothetical protein
VSPLFLGIQSINEKFLNAITFVMLLWIAYEPNVDTCLIDIYIKKRDQFLYVCYQFFKQLKNRFGRKNHYLQMYLDVVQ